MDSKICSNCIGLDKCNKYCILQAGTNLVNFINGIDIIETQIGELREDARTKKLSYVVSGHIIEVAGAPTYILSDLSTSTDASGKFLSYNGVTPQQIIKTYLDGLSMAQEGKDEAINTFKKFNTNKLLPVPLKPGAECEIGYTDYSGKRANMTTRVSSVKWSSDRKTGKLNCEILCELEKGVLENNAKTVKIPIKEYGENIKLPQIERTLKSAETDRELIVMTSVGFIKPIVVIDEKFTLAVDNKYLYRIVDDKTFIVGVWKSGKIAAFQGGIDDIAKSKAYKKIHNGANYIERHRRFIVPYGLFETNKIDLR